MRRIAISVSAFAVAWAAVVLSGQQPAAPPGQAQGQGAGRGAAAPPPPMSFFITSVGLGKGGDLGGLAGADAHCQALATAAGRGSATWRAYLSTQGPNAVNARDRIGNGPWNGPGGQQVARNLSHLHGDTLEEARMGNGLNALHAMSEKGQVLQGRIGGTPANPVVHDILTGTMPDGRAYTDGVDHTCSNWTSSAEGVGGAQVGHHDRAGFDNNSWNSTHGARGCSQVNVSRGGGAGLFYCFAVN
jgi:hypothetical protein